MVNDVRTDDGISPGGTFGAAFPLWDGTGRMFTVWSPCRLLDVDDKYGGIQVGDSISTLPTILPASWPAAYAFDL